MKEYQKLIDIIEKYIRLSPEKSVVKFLKIRLTDFVHEGKVHRVFVSTRSLKHVYDKRPAEEFDRCVLTINEILDKPLEIYDNTSKEGKRGSILLSYSDKHKQKYLCVLEKEDMGNNYNVVTFFRLRKENYLKSYKLIWSQEDGEPLS